MMVIVTAGHHGADGVIDHRYNVNVKVLQRKRKKNQILVWPLKQPQTLVRGKIMTYVKLYVVAGYNGL